MQVAVCVSMYLDASNMLSQQQREWPKWGVKSGQARHKIRVSTFGAATAHVGAAMSGAIAPASALLRSSIFEAQQVISTHKAGKIMWPTAVAAAPIPCTRRK